MPKATKLPSGNWRCRIYDGKNADGSERYKSFTAKTKKAAESAAVLWQIEKPEREAEEERQRQRDAAPTLGDAMEQYIETCRAQNYSPATIAGYVKIMRNSFPGIIDKKIVDITQQDIQLAINERICDHSPKTVRNDCSLITAVMSRNRPDLNLRGLIIAKGKKPKKKIMKQVWAKDILAEARKISTDFYIYTSFIISAGLRPSETHSLTWADISKDPIIRLDQGGSKYNVGTITIDSASVRGDDGRYHEKDPKTEAGYRTLEVDWSFFEDLYSVKPRGSDDDKIVARAPNCSRPWAKVRKAIGMPDGLRFYDLRHYFATNAKLSGATDEDLAARMGHSSPIFTHNVYVEIIEEAQAEASKNLANRTRDLYKNQDPDEGSSENATLTRSV